MFLYKKYLITIQRRPKQIVIVIVKHIFYRKIGAPNQLPITFCQI